MYPFILSLNTESYPPQCLLKYKYKKDKKLWLRPLVHIMEPYETGYNTKKYRAVRDDQRNIIGFKRIGVKNGKVISVISSIKE